MTAEQNQHPIPQEAFDWYDEYAHGMIDRRTFLARLATLGLAATALAGLMPNYALAEQVSFNDPDILARYVTFPSPEGHGEGGGYLVAPREVAGEIPVVLVVHENRGLNPYIKDVARRLAKAGYLALAPDALFSLGGYPGNDDEGRTMQRGMDRAKIEQDFIAAARFLKSHEQSSGKLGAVGFCFGGYIVNMLAAVDPDVLDAGVPYYGTPASSELWSGIRGPLLVQLASLDKRVNSSWPEYKDALDAMDVPYAMHMYDEANHGFHNDSTSRYDAGAAELSWRRTLKFFAESLG